MKRHFIPTRTLSLFLILLCTSCEELAIDPASIFEADSSVQIPLVNNLNENIDGTNADFSWQGNEFALQFSCKLEINNISGLDDPLQFIFQPYNNWSDWTTNLGRSFSKLDDGNYTFYVKSRFEENEEIEPHMSRSFAIDAISGPALRIYPQNQTANTGDIINVYLYFEDVPSEMAVTGLHVDIYINSAELEFMTQSFEQGQLVTQFPGVTIFPNPRYSEDGNTMSIDGVVFTNGSGLFGTGSIAKFSLRVLAGSATTPKIDIATDGSYLDMNGNPIVFQHPFSGMVTVEGAGQ